MARVLMPTMARRYNPNPRGSSTTTVTMKSNNPFESNIQLHNANALPGMSGLGNVAPAPATSPNPMAAQAPSGGFDWTGLMNAIGQTGVQVGGQLATNRIQELYGPKPQPLTAPGAQYLPVGVPLAQPKPWLPWALVGGGVLAAGVILFAFRGKKSKKR